MSLGRFDSRMLLATGRVVRCPTWLDRLRALSSSLDVFCFNAATYIHAHKQPQGPIIPYPYRIHQILQDWFWLQQGALVPVCGTSQLPVAPRSCFVGNALSAVDSSRPSCCARKKQQLARLQIGCHAVVLSNRCTEGNNPGCSHNRLLFPALPRVRVTTLQSRWKTTTMTGTGAVTLQSRQHSDYTSKSQ